MLELASRINVTQTSPLLFSKLQIYVIKFFIEHTPMIEKMQEIQQFNRARLT